jgi:hypothetical protein
MNHPSSRRTSSRTSKRLNHAIWVAALAGGLFAGSTQAQVIVSDPILEGSGAAIDLSTAKSLSQEVLSYARQFEQLQQEVATVQNILMKAQNLGTDISLFDSNLQLISNPDSIINSACPGAGGGGIVGSALNSLASALNPNQPVATRQQMICAQIVTYEVDEYNKTATALNAMGSVHDSTLNKLNSLIASVDTLGKTSNAQAQTAGVNLNVVTAMSTWQTQIKADDAIIETLKKQQSILAKVAMNGNATPLGTLVQATALKAAFTINQ